MRPRPTIPMTLPRSMVPGNWVRSHPPSRTCLVAAGSRRAQARTSAQVSSAAGVRRSRISLSGQGRSRDVPGEGVASMWSEPVVAVVNSRSDRARRSRAASKGTAMLASSTTPTSSSPVSTSTSVTARGAPCSLGANAARHRSGRAGRVQNLNRQGASPPAAPLWTARRRCACRRARRRTGGPVRTDHPRPDANGREDGVAIVRDVDDVLPAVATVLSRADVHRRNAEVRALSDGDAEDADDGAGSEKDPEEVVRSEVLEEVQVPGVHAVDLPKGGCLRTSRRCRHPGWARTTASADRSRRQRGVSSVTWARAYRVLGGDRVLQHDEMLAAQVDVDADAAVLGEEVPVELGAVEHLLGDVDRRAPCDVDRRSQLTHPHDPLGGVLSGHEVQVCELRDGVTNLLVDRSRHLTSLDVDHRQVHVSAGDRGGDDLEPIGDDDDAVRSELVEHGGGLDHAETGRLRHRERGAALEHVEDPRCDIEAVLLDVANDAAVTVEERRRRQHELQVDVLVLSPREAPSAPGYRTDGQ